MKKYAARLAVLILLCLWPLMAGCEGFQRLGLAADSYVLPGAREVKVVSDQGKTLYKWRQFALRVVGEKGEKLCVALPGGSGWVNADKTLPWEGAPEVWVDLSAPESGAVSIAARGEVPILAELCANGKTHALLLPLDGKGRNLLLTLGTGEYTLTLWEAGLNDEKVRQLKQYAFTAETLPTDQELALMSSVHTCLEDHPLTLIKARELCAGLETDTEKVKALWAWLKKNGAYDRTLARNIQFSEIPDGDHFLRGEKGICCDDAAFMACALRSMGIPCQHVYGLNVRTGNHHAWNRVWLEGEWVIVDVTMDRSRNVKEFAFQKEKYYEPVVGLYEGFH